LDLATSVVSGVEEGRGLTGALSGAVAVAFHDDLVGVAGEAVECAPGEDGIIEEGDPLVDGAVGGDDGGGSTVALDDDLAEVAGLPGVEPAESEVVDDEQVGIEEAPDPVAIEGDGGIPVEVFEGVRLLEAGAVEAGGKVLVLAAIDLVLEGEFIAWRLEHHLRPHGPVHRVTFQEVTSGSASMGRVQTPTLGFVVEREYVVPEEGALAPTEEALALVGADSLDALTGGSDGTASGLIDLLKKRVEAEGKAEG
jgi:hypothetical protein